VERSEFKKFKSELRSELKSQMVGRVGLGNWVRFVGIVNGDNCLLKARSNVGNGQKSNHHNIS
jgi:hypothetical protein